MLYQSILITGGGGMLAAALREALQSRGHQPVLVRRAELDIADEASVAAAFGRYQPTLVLNCAAHTKVDLCEKEQPLANAINGYAVGHLAKFAKQTGAALVHFSTDYVFDGTLRRPLRVDDPVGPRSAYGQSKLLGEQLLQRHAPHRWLILRTAWLYGRGGPCFPATMINAANAGKPLKVVSDQVGSPTYTVDLAETALALLDAHAQGIYHVSNSGETNWQAFAQATLDQFGIVAQVASLTSADWKAMRPESADRPAYSVLDLSPVERLLGRPMASWRAALARYHAAVVQRGF